jgi:hypothetical protein
VGRLDELGEGVRLGLGLISLLGRIGFGFGFVIGEGRWRWVGRVGGDRSVEGLDSLVGNESYISPFLALVLDLLFLFLFPVLGLGLGHGLVPLCSEKQNHQEGEAYKQKKTNSTSNAVREAVVVVAVVGDASSSPSPSPYLHPPPVCHRGTDRPDQQVGGRYPALDAGGDKRLGKNGGYLGCVGQWDDVHRMASPGARQRRSWVEGKKKWDRDREQGGRRLIAQISIAISIHVASPPFCPKLEPRYLLLQRWNQQLAIPSSNPCATLCHIFHPHLVHDRILDPPTNAIAAASFLFYLPL